MPERRVTVASRVGLHARPAAVFVRAAVRTGLGITVAKDAAQPADARSLLAVMSLDVRCGDEVILAAEGAGAEAALDELAALLASDLDADPATPATPGSAPAAPAAPSAPAASVETAADA